MKYLSTSGQSPPTDLLTALTNGIAPDGGLYLPEKFGRIPRTTLSKIKGLPFDQVARIISEYLLGDDLSSAELDELTHQSLNFSIPLCQYQKDVFGLELFHGPTLSFKDVGARFLAHLLDLLRKKNRKTLYILVATSGDTGSAVAQGFLNKEGIQTVILYPSKGVTPLQESQFSTLGGNVHALKVSGTFDDCQNMVKSAFLDRELNRQIKLGSANSINIGRLLPQVFYYFHAHSQLPGSEPILFSVPSGNFGNLTAGLIAKRLGLPVRGFTAATNINDTVPEYLITGHVRTRPSIRTISNAMDVGDPSNLARMEYLYNREVSRIRKDIIGSVHSDEETRLCIRTIYKSTGKILDPHSAVGYLGIESGLLEFGTGPSIFLMTAHPIKFRETVEQEIDSTLEIPEIISSVLSAKRQVVSIGNDVSELRDFLIENKET
ncbi:MAG: threonine synthase [Longimicrobiales bacterium]